ncbi:asparaginase [Rugosimonospora acidiphila]|uniref:Asparaginase n=1 Tax=Rugosimonospora acidiphila TaxID=556531 RepID=A0ABP9RV64_9ACTN
MPSTTPGSPPRVTLFGLGGTIAMTGTGGVVPSLSAEQLVAAVPGLAGAGVELDVVSFRSRPGAAVTFADLTELAGAVRESLAAGTQGVVVTQGTDTIEETAYLLDLLRTGTAPIVVTGAMRNPTLAGADGPANLLAAVQVAASPHAAGLGCLVVFADEIHAAGRVRKSHATSPGTFVSPTGGPLGYVVEGSPVIVNRPARRYTIGAAPGQPTALPREPVGDAHPRHNPAPAALPRVGLYTATLGDDAALLPRFTEDLDGLVVAGFGAGHVPDTWVPALTEAAARIPVVLASRTGAGPVLSGTYGFPGSERDLLSRGLIRAGFLDSVKARILLHCLLAAGTDRAGIAAAFATVDGLGG